MAIREIGHHIVSLMGAALGHRLSKTMLAVQRRSSTGAFVDVTWRRGAPKGVAEP